MVKILYVIGTLEIGGSERQLVSLVKGLDRSKFSPAVFCLTAQGPLVAELTQAGVKVECFGLRGLRVLRNPGAIARRLSTFSLALRHEQPAIVHGFLFHAYVLGTVAAKLAGVPIVITSRRSLGHFKAKRPHYRIAERLANRMTDLVIANSEAVKQDVVDNERWEPAKVEVIHNGVDASAYDVAADPALRRALGVPDDCRIVGVFANLIPYKGYRFFLRACQEIKRQYSAVKFLVVGDGPLRGELGDLATDLGLEKDLLFLGVRRDIPELLAITDAAVLPSLEEGFPNAVLEAMAAGKPLVATRVGGIPEAVVHGQTGLLVPPGDSGALAEAIRWLLEHPVDAARIGAAGRRRAAERFPMAAMVRQYEDIYERLVRGKREEEHPCAE